MKIISQPVVVLVPTTRDLFLCPLLGPKHPITARDFGFISVDTYRVIAAYISRDDGAFLSESDLTSILSACRKGLQLQRRHGFAMGETLSRGRCMEAKWLLASSKRKPFRFILPHTDMGKLTLM